MTHFQKQYGLQKAVLWAFSSFDADGRPQVSAAVEIDVVAWNESTKQSLDKESSSIVYDTQATVFQDITQGSCLRLGKLRDLPATINNVREVVNFSSVKSINGKETQRSVFMMRRASLPEIV